MKDGEVLDSLPDAVIVLDARRCVTGWYGAASRIFGFSADEAEGREIDELLCPRDENGNKCCIGPCEPERVLRITRRMPEYEVLTTTKSGKDQWVGVGCNFERAPSGEMNKIVLILRDAGKRKRIDLEKSEVISAVSHELRSPLTSVKGFTSTLINKWERFDDETKLQLLATINADADRVTRLLTELLDVSRIEAGRLQLRRQMITLVEVAEQVVERLGSDSESHTVETAFPPGLPHVYADPDKIQQVLTNLIENALKYTEGGLVKVTGGDDGGLVRVSVDDQGEGIPPEQRLQIFGKFFRRGGRRENPTGTGLGLYISKGLVEAHGGKMWVDDSPGGGSRFAFTLPTSGPDGLES